MSHTSITEPVVDSSRLLRAALNANAFFCGASALFMLIDAGMIASWLNLPASWPVRVAGLGLLGFAISVAFLARRPTINPSEGMAMVIADAMWVVGSAVALLAYGSNMTITGQWVVGIVALIVLVFAELEYVGTKRLT